jgi:hypothetical protein
MPPRASPRHPNFNWYSRLFQDPEFRQKVKDRWPVFKDKLEQLCRENGIIDQYKQKISVSQKCTFEKFGLTPKKRIDNSLDSDSIKKENEFIQNYDEFFNLCYPNLFSENDIFIDNFKDEVKGAFNESGLDLDEQDIEILEDIDTNERLESILKEYCGYAEHEKLLFF